MKNSTIITIIAFTLGVVLLVTGFILFTNNNISNGLLNKSDKNEEDATTTIPTTTTPTTTRPTYEAMDLFATDVSQYVTLGDYKGMTIEVEKIEATSEEVEFYIQQVLAIDGEYIKIRDQIIGEKMIFSFDYTGYHIKEDGTKGTAFSGGAGTDQLAYIDGDTLFTLSSSGAGTFIDGFAQGILGTIPGETFDLEITFPEDYGSADLKGKKTIFEIKVNHIVQGDFNDGWVKEYTNNEYENCDEYREFVKKSITNTYKDTNIATLWETIVENAVVIEIPEQEFNYWYYYFIDQIEYYQMMYQMYGYNYTYEQMLQLMGFENDEALKKYAEEIVTEELITFAIIKAEGLEASDEEYRIMLDSLIEQTGKTEAEVLELYSEETIRQQIVLNKVNDHLYDLNTFVLKAE